MNPHDVSFDDAHLLRSIGKSRQRQQQQQQQQQFRPQASTLASRRHNPNVADLVPDWGPAIPSEATRLEGERRAPPARHQSSSGKSRISPLDDEYGLFNSSPGVGRASPRPSTRPASSLLQQKTRVGPSRLRPVSPSSASSSASAPSSSDEGGDSPYRPVPMQSRDSTGNHHALAATTTWTQAAAAATARQRKTARNSATTLGPEALRKLDRFAAATTSASESESSSNRKHSHAAAAAAAAESTYGPPGTGSQRRKDSCEPTYIGAAAGAAPSTHRHDMPSSPSPAPTRRGANAAFGAFAQGPQNQNDTAQAQTSKSNHDSSAETLVDAPLNDKQQRHAFDAALHGMNAGGYTKILPHRGAVQSQGHLLLPTGVEMAPRSTTQKPSLFLPDDVTGLTDALESPQKTRLGVRHVALHPHVGRLDVEERKMKIAQIKAFVTEIADELNTTKDRLDGVETREEELRGDFTRLRDEWQRPAAAKKATSKGTAQAHRETVVDTDVAVKLVTMSDHVAALHDEMRYYRTALEDMQRGREGERKGEGSARETTAHHRGPTPRQHSRHHHEVDDDDNDDVEEAHDKCDDADADADDEYSPEYLELKADIHRVEQQLSQVRLIVERGQQKRSHDVDVDDERPSSAAPRRPTSSSTRRVRMASEAAATRRSVSDPLRTAADPLRTSQPPFGRRVRAPSATARPASSATTRRAEPRSDDIDDTALLLDYDVRSSTLPAAKAAATRRRRSGDGSEVDRGDEEEVPRRHGRVVDAQFEDELTMADARVNRTLRNVMKSKKHSGGQDRQKQDEGDDDDDDEGTPSAGPLADLSHDPSRCTVCVSAEERQGKRAARKARVMASVQRHAAEDPVTGNVEEDVILSILTSSEPGAIEALLRRRGEQQTSSTALTSLLQRMLRRHMDEFYHARLLYSELADELKQMDPLSSKWTETKRRILVEHVLERVEELEARAERIDVLRGLLDASSGDGDRRKERSASTSASASGNMGASRNATDVKDPAAPSASASASSHRPSAPGATTTNATGTATLRRALANSPPHPMESQGAMGSRGGKRSRRRA